MERLAYEDATLVAIDGTLFGTLQHPKVQDTVWFWGGSPVPYLEEAWIKK